MKRVALFLAIFSVLCCLAIAKEATPLSNDPEVEKRLMALSEQLRCLVCQNESLAGSQADLAKDLRDLIREQMKAGKTDKEVIAFLTGRYGKFILYKPPVDPTTYLLWFGPFVFLLAGLALLFRYVKRRRELITEQPLSADERRRVETLLQSAPGKEIA